MTGHPAGYGLWSRGGCPRTFPRSTGCGFWLLGRAWPVLYAAQQTGRLACAGPYARLRHSQYAAFVLVMFGFLLQWPTLIMLLLFPILAVAYARLARHEEREALAAFGDAYRRYMDETPAWWPKWGRRS